MVGRPRREDAVRNREAVQTAARAVFSRQGEALTMDCVATEAEVSKGTVYATYCSRERLIGEMTVQVLEEAAAAYRRALAADDPWAELTGLIVNPHFGLVPVALLDPAAPDSPERRALEASRRAFASLVDHLKERGIVRPEVSVEQITTLFHGLFAVLPRYPDRSPERAEELVTIILRGIQVDAETALR